MLAQGKRMKLVNESSEEQRKKRIEKHAQQQHTHAIKLMFCFVAGYLFTHQIHPPHTHSFQRNEK